MASSIGVVERKRFFGQENDKVVVKWGSTVDGGKISEKYSKNVSGVELIIGPLQLTVTWYKIHHAGDKAMDWDIQNKENSSLTGSEVVLFGCSSAKRTLHHGGFCTTRPLAANGLLNNPWIVCNYEIVSLTTKYLDQYASGTQPARRAAPVAVSLCTKSIA